MTEVLAPNSTAGEATGARKTALILLRTCLPIVLALIASAVLLLALGQNPLSFFGDILYYGLAGNGWQRSLTLMAPLLLVALALIVVFRGKLWNLGYDGQFLLGAVLIAGVGPSLVVVVPLWLALPLLCIGAMIVSASWTVVPAALKAVYGTNEIITTLMMSFIGVGLANMLIKGPFQDPNVIVPQTRVLPLETMLPYIPGTRVHVGLIIALVVVVAAHVVLTRTSVGLRLDVFGANPKAAHHVGIRSRPMIMALFAISGALIGLAAAVDLLGQWGFLRTNWNPAYGAAVMPFVFLARLNPLGSVPLIGLYSVLSTGGTLAAHESGLSVDFLLIIVALILVFMALIEFLGTRRSLGQSYLPPGLLDGLRRGARRGGSNG
ncbi:putative B6 ABC transporter permease subunit 2 [Lysinibacter cavernae]|uniref:Simple sugar transport system permease protein n=1 Tax=Lysinibacter cavernae TaxID=1640652 RepID=A0A7X5R219_9MICO|nr:ABC transporter permease [Lysinibacter cavernae]NIH54239.1 simple sugar transport system permease protein [Lysinibacter cavernae]